MNDRNIRVDLGVMSFIVLITFVLYWSGWIGKSLGTVGGMIAAAGIAFILFAIRSGLDAENKAAKKYLLFGSMLAITMYFMPILWTFWIGFGAFSPKTRGVVAQFKKGTEEFLAERLGEDSVVTQELARCNMVMLADQKPFLEGPTGLKQLANKKAAGSISQELYERWHAYNVTEIQKVHKQRGECGKRAKLLSPSATSMSSSGGTSPPLPSGDIIHTVVYEWPWWVTFLIVPFAFVGVCRVVLGREFIKSRRAKALGGALALSWFVIVMYLRAP